MKSRFEWLQELRASFEEIFEGGDPCSLCGSGPGGSRVPIEGEGPVRVTICRGCIEGLYLATHQNEHILARFDECPACAKNARDRGDQRKVIECRYRVITCEVGGPSCERDAIVDVGTHGDHYTLSPGWGVLEMEAMVDYQRFICPPCRRQPVLRTTPSELAAGSTA